MLRMVLAFAAVGTVATVTHLSFSRGLAAVAAPADPCSLVASDEVTRILGFPTTPPDDVSRRNGSCYFYSRSASEDGTLAYRVVRDGDLAALRRTFAGQKIMCGGVAPEAPRYQECSVYRKLAAVDSPRAYCSIRTDLPDAEPFSEGAFAATFAAGSLFSMRDGACYEARVMHGDRPQHDAEIALLKLLIARSGG